MATQNRTHKHKSEMSFENDFTDGYEDRSKKHLDKLDFKALNRVKSKELKNLTDEDLLAIGFARANTDEIENLFYYEDLNGIKIYVNKSGDKFELRGFRLRKEKDINSTAELLDETLTKWRLKMK